MLGELASSPPDASRVVDPQESPSQSRSRFGSDGSGRQVLLVVDSLTSRSCWLYQRTAMPGGSTSLMMRAVSSRRLARKPNHLDFRVRWWTLSAMHLEGWNSIPDGYGARFDLTGAPRWLRVWFRTPFVDRFAYPVVVRRGYGILTSNPGTPASELGPVPSGWRTSQPS